MALWDLTTREGVAALQRFARRDARQAKKCCDIIANDLWAAGRLQVLADVVSDNLRCLRQWDKAVKVFLDAYLQELNK